MAEYYAVRCPLNGDREHTGWVGIANGALEEDGLANEIAHELVGGFFVEYAGLALLLDDSVVHQRNAVRQAQGLYLVVRNEQYRDVEPPLEELDLDPHLLA